MDITPTTPTTNANSNTAGAAGVPAAQAPKSPDLDSETPTRIQPAKPLSFTNGVLKRHHPHQHHGHHHHHHLLSAAPVVVTYKECLKNHAATLGGHAVDGCGEFMPSPSATHTDPTSLKCAACGCHRNFHRREPEDSPPHLNTTTTIEYQPHHRHHPPPPPPQPHRSPNSASPPPISSSYCPSVPHMLLALSGGVSGLNDGNAAMNITPPGSSTRKRFRTKFSQSQKERMHQFAERVGWKIQKRDEDLIQEFCNEVGVDKGVLKVWMHNNKNTYGKRDSINGAGSISGRSNSNNNNNNIEDHNHHHQQNHNNNNSSSNNNNNNNNNTNSSSENLNLHPLNFESDSHAGHVGTNGSSSSS